MNKKTVIALVSLVLVVALMAGIYLATRPQTQAGAKEITVTVIHADGSSKTFTYHTDEEYLGAVLIAEGLVEGSEGPYGLEMHTVDGEKASWEESQSYWALYVGEEYGVTGVDTTPIADGDTFKLVYTIG